jgi:hypothetical protein
MDQLLDVHVLTLPGLLDMDAFHRAEDDARKTPQRYEEN